MSSTFGPPQSAGRASQKHESPGNVPHGLREWINGHPGWAIGGLAVFIAAIILFEHRSKGRIRASYTIDDGQTFFSQPYVVPPFDHQGKEAVQAVMFTCDHGDTHFVGYLLRFKPEAKLRIESQLKLGADTRGNRGPMDMNGAEVKRPGDSAWVGYFDPRDTGKVIQDAIRKGQDPRKLKLYTFDEITKVSCPDGKYAIPVGSD